MDTIETKDSKACAVCEAAVDADAIFCNECGSLQNEVVAKPATKQCPKCNHSLALEINFCSKCGFSFAEIQVGDANASDLSSVDEKAHSAAGRPTFAEDSGSLPVNLAGKVMTRYQDGYRVANTITLFGTLVKIFSIIAGFIIGLIGLGIGAAIAETARRSTFGYSEGSPAAIIIGALFCLIGFVVAVIGWILGVIISANGQMVKANLDCAVYASPFIEDIEKAEVMGLSSVAAKNPLSL